jgi:hypothetical protein
MSLLVIAKRREFRLALARLMVGLALGMLVMLASTGCHQLWSIPLP